MSKSNADRIRAMSDEELAEFLTRYEFNQCEFCSEQLKRCHQECGDYVLPFLQREVKEDE